MPLQHLRRVPLRLLAMCLPIQQLPIQPLSISLPLQWLLLLLSQLQSAHRLQGLWRLALLLLRQPWPMQQMR